MLNQEKIFSKYNVMVLKDSRLDLRIREDVKKDLKVMAELHGLSMTGFINSLIVRAIREEKDREPRAFIKLGGKGKILEDAVLDKDLPLNQTEADEVAREINADKEEKAA